MMRRAAWFLALLAALCLAQAADPALVRPVWAQSQAVSVVMVGDEELILVRVPRPGFAPPSVELLAGAQPRAVVDVEGVTSWTEDYRVLAGGRRVKAVRSYLHEDEHRLRVVLDLALVPSNCLITLGYEPQGDDILLTIAVGPRPRGLP